MALAWHWRLIPQTFQDRAVDVGRDRAYLARAEALGSTAPGSEQSWADPEPRPVELLTMPRR